jgi:predicted ATPase
MIHTLAISGYRSLRDIIIELDKLTIITGTNGSGKSSLYRALRLLSDIAQGRVVSSLAREGGLSSTLWAGPEKFSAGMKSGDQKVEGTVRSGPISLRLGFSSDDYGYAIDLGLPAPSYAHTRFTSDPEIKAEAIWTGEVLGRNTLFAERKASFVNLRSSDSGEWRQVSDGLSAIDSIMTHCADSKDGFELLLLRERMRNWRFYDHLRVDSAAPARSPQVGTFTPILASDGSDIGAAIQTIFELGDGDGLAETIADAFDGAELGVNERFEVEMHQQGLLRPLSSAELSDGTLRYILLTAALLSPRPPELMILNEPESSLHPQLLAPLGRLMAKVAKKCQMIVVSHADELVDALQGNHNSKVITLQKELGETIIPNMTIIDRPKWKWPVR